MEGEGGEKEEWRPTSVTLLPVQIVPLAATSTQPLWAMGAPLISFILTSNVTLIAISSS